MALTICACGGAQVFAARVSKWRRKGSLFGMSGTDVESVDEKRGYSTHDDDSDAYHASFSSLNTSIHVHATSESLGKGQDTGDSTQRDSVSTPTKPCDVACGENGATVDSMGERSGSARFSRVLNVTRRASSALAQVQVQAAYSGLYTVRAPLKHADYLSLLLVSPVKGDDAHITATKLRVMQSDELRKKQELMGRKAGLVRLFWSSLTPRCHHVRILCMVPAGRRSLVACP
jgi:hypothetical protein